MDYFDMYLYNSIEGARRDREARKAEFARQDYEVEMKMRQRNMEQTASAHQAEPPKPKQESKPPQAQESELKLEADEHGTVPYMTHLAEIRRIYWEIIDGNDIGMNRSDYELLFSGFMAKTIAERVMEGDIPAADKILETEFYFAEFRVDMQCSAHEYLRSFRGKDEFKDQFEVVDGKVPKFWKALMVMASRADLEYEYVHMATEYFGLMMSLNANMRRKYPRGNYTEKRAFEYGLVILDAISRVCD